MPEILQKLKSEIKAGLSSSDHHYDDAGNNRTGARKGDTTASPGVGGIIPADVPGGGDPSAAAAAAAHSDRQTLQKAAAAEAGGAGTAGSGSTGGKSGVLRSEEAHARDRAGSERMTLRKAAAHEEGGRQRARGVIGVYGQHPVRWFSKVCFEQRDDLAVDLLAKPVIFQIESRVYEFAFDAPAHGVVVVGAHFDIDGLEMLQRGLVVEQQVPPLSILSWFDFDTELEQLLADIDETVNYLYKVSAGLRNTPQHDRLMSSLAINTSFYEDFDIQHVHNKHPNVEPEMAQRLGKAISMRRHYFKYRESHRGKLGSGLEAGDRAADGKSTIASSLPDELRKAELVYGKLDVDNRSESGFTQTSFATSVADSTKLRVPPLPKEAATQEYFEYCEAENGDGHESIGHSDDIDDANDDAGLSDLGDTDDDDDDAEGKGQEQAQDRQEAEPDVFQAQSP
ncbi:uncharacterized protein PG986_014612 [Apiospora aurea]|uniref:Uncharacterized protein n=1 Tax=Apiospora aurea TaxID=335848 RepID=A0ABR1PTG4_9PEZI